MRGVCGEDRVEWPFCMSRLVQGLDYKLFFSLIILLFLLLFFFFACLCDKKGLLDSKYFLFF